VKLLVLPLAAGAALAAVLAGALEAAADLIAGLADDFTAAGALFFAGAGALLTADEELELPPPIGWLKRVSRGDGGILEPGQLNGGIAIEILEPTIRELRMPVKAMLPAMRLSTRSKTDLKDILYLAEVF
jgi:hypothetical protein